MSTGEAVPPEALLSVPSTPRSRCTVAGRAFHPANNPALSGRCVCTTIHSRPGGRSSRACGIGLFRLQYSTTTLQALSLTRLTLCVMVLILVGGISPYTPFRSFTLSSIQRTTAILIRQTLLERTPYFRQVYSFVRYGYDLARLRLYAEQLAPKVTSGRHRHHTVGTIGEATGRVRNSYQRTHVGGYSSFSLYPAGRNHVFVLPRAAAVSPFHLLLFTGPVPCRCRPH